MIYHNILFYYFIFITHKIQMLLQYFVIFMINLIIQIEFQDFIYRLHLM